MLVGQEILEGQEVVNIEANEAMLQGWRPVHWLHVQA